MRLVLQSVVLSVGAMVNVSVVILIFFVIFGILGVQVFAGRFFRCTDPSVASKAACVGTFLRTRPEPSSRTETSKTRRLPGTAPPIKTPSPRILKWAQAAHPQNSASFHQSSSFLARREWVNAYLNFDNLYRALVSLFVTATLDGYGGLMFDALDATGVDRQPRMDANPEAFLFFLAFIVLCAFTLLNLYVGVIFYQFSRIRTLSQTSSIDLTEEQKEWAEMCKVALRLRPLRRPREPPRTEPWFRWYAFRVATHRRFENAILACVALNVAFLASAHRDEPIRFGARSTARTSSSRACSSRRPRSRSTRSGSRSTGATLGTGSISSSRRRRRRTPSSAPSWSAGPTRAAPGSRPGTPKR